MSIGNVHKTGPNKTYMRNGEKKNPMGRLEIKQPGVDDEN